MTRRIEIWVDVEKEISNQDFEDLRLSLENHGWDIVKDHGLNHPDVFVQSNEVSAAINDPVKKFLLGAGRLHFLNGDNVFVDIREVIFDCNGEPIILINDDGSVFKWNQILGIEK